MCVECQIEYAEKMRRQDTIDTDEKIYSRKREQQTKGSITVCLRGLPKIQAVRVGRTHTHTHVMYNHVADLTVTARLCVAILYGTTLLIFAASSYIALIAPSALLVLLTSWTSCYRSTSISCTHVRTTNKLWTNQLTPTLLHKYHSTKPTLIQANDTMGTQSYSSSDTFVFRTPM